MKKLYVVIAVLLVALLSVGAASAAQAQVDVNCNVNGATITINGESGVLTEGIVSGGVASFQIDTPATITSIVANADGHTTATKTINYKLDAGEKKSFDIELTAKPIGGNVGWVAVNVNSYNVNTQKTTPMANAKVELYSGDTLYGTSTADANGNVKFEVYTTGTPVTHVIVTPTSVGSEIKTITVESPAAGETSTYTAQYTDTTKPTSSPFPILGILAGLGIAGVLLARRNH